MTAQRNLVTPVHMVDQNGNGFWVLRYDDGYYYNGETDDLLAFDTEKEAREYLPKGMYREATASQGTQTAEE